MAKIPLIFGIAISILRSLMTELTALATSSGVLIGCEKTISSTSSIDLSIKPVETGPGETIPI